MLRLPSSRRRPAEPPVSDSLRTVFGAWTRAAEQVASATWMTAASPKGASTTCSSASLQPRSAHVPGERQALRQLPESKSSLRQARLRKKPRWQASLRVTQRTHPTSREECLDHVLVVPAQRTLELIARAGTLSLRIVRTTPTSTNSSGIKSCLRKAHAPREIEAQSHALRPRKITRLSSSQHRPSTGGDRVDLEHRPHQRAPLWILTAWLPLPTLCA